MFYDISMSDSELISSVILDLQVKFVNDAHEQSFIEVMRKEFHQIYKSGFTSSDMKRVFDYTRPMTNEDVEELIKEAKKEKMNFLESCSYDEFFNYVIKNLNEIKSTIDFNHKAKAKSSIESLSSDIERKLRQLSGG